MFWFFPTSICIRPLQGNQVLSREQIDVPKLIKVIEDLMGS